MVISLEIKILIIAVYFGNGKSIKKVQEEIKKRWPTLPKYPSRNGIVCTIKKFKETGSLFRKKFQRQKNVLTEDKVIDVLALIHSKPQISISKLAATSGISYGPAHNIIKSNKFRPYKQQKVQKLKGILLIFDVAWY